MNWEAWRAAVRGAAKSQTRLSNRTTVRTMKMETVKIDFNIAWNFYFQKSVGCGRGGEGAGGGKCKRKGSQNGQVRGGSVARASRPSAAPQELRRESWRYAHRPSVVSDRLARSLGIMTTDVKTHASLTTRSRTLA